LKWLQFTSLINTTCPKEQSLSSIVITSTSSLTWLKWSYSCKKGQAWSLTLVGLRTIVNHWKAKNGINIPTMCTIILHFKCYNFKSQSPQIRGWFKASMLAALTSIAMHKVKT
jgi:hypothetical protein